MAKPRISFLFYITLVLSLVIASDAKAVDYNHQVSHNRFLKKRAPQIGTLPGTPQPVNGAGANPTITSAVETQSASTATTADSTPASSVSSASSSSSATSTSAGLVGSIVSAVLPTTTSSSSSSSTSSSSTSPTSTQSTSSTPSTTQSLQTSPGATATPVQTGSQTSQSVVFITNTAATSASATPSSLSSSSTGITHTALIVLIVIATSVGGSIIIWTIIRKWKFGKSSSFDDRMQPIDWQPPSNNDDDNGGIPGLNRRNSNASSFHSGSGHAGIGATVLNPIPDHDFTAGPANLAPVGGYADLARGPSPQPMMQELARGPSFNSHQYQSDQYGVPLHHGGYATGY
ncbi:hypothetical protein DEU56DRAFT_769717 [Suillus clintonianus]|uniref:uncharacterized protein n=1 Tax=Suillus clintonianus TaxID=1904413 RepID=UPI001B886694|nr:uncharacterized protein DEU56DRAFT_769717 [Suillus clintonianus]KAG2154676.1 hypothetical protein DEU56DRAFT_769717 [Suillus clintonianus]